MILLRAAIPTEVTPMASHLLSLLNVETQCSYDLIPEPRSEKPYQKACIWFVVLKARAPGGPVSEEILNSIVRLER